MAAPSKSILDRAFKYVPSSATDVTQTWRRAGWRPLAELPAPKVTQMMRTVKK